MIDTGLAGRVVVVTGANNPRGIGAATARAFAGQGSRVLLTAFGEPSADAVVAEIRAAGGRAESMEADLGDPAVVPRVFDRAEREYGPVDVLVHNASPWEADTFLPADVEKRERAGRLWPLSSATVGAGIHDRIFAVNSRATALLIAEFARRAIERGARGGRIVTVTTNTAGGFPREVSYAASKAALESYSRSAAAELARHGITVNVVCPTATQTGWMPAEMEKELARSLPFGVGRAEDVADAILFLASAQAAAITGQLVALGNER